MDLGIADKVAIVAGGSRGCGRGTAEALAAEGARVVLVGRQPDIVAAATDEIRSSGGTVHGVASDMTTETGVAEILDQTREVFGDPAILVVNSPAPDRRSSEHTRGFDNCADEDFLAS